MQDKHEGTSVNYEKTITNGSGIYFDYGHERELFSLIDSEVKLKRCKSDSNLFHSRNTELVMGNNKKQTLGIVNEETVERFLKLKNTKPKEHMITAFKKFSQTKNKC